MNLIDKTFDELKNEQNRIKSAIKILRKNRARITTLTSLSNRIVISLVPENSTRII